MYSTAISKMAIAPGPRVRRVEALESSRQYQQLGQRDTRQQRSNTGESGYKNQLLTGAREGRIDKNEAPRAVKHAVLQETTEINNTGHTNNDMNYTNEGQHISYNSRAQVLTRTERLINILGVYV